MSEPHSHVPFGEDGSGFYSDNVDGCYDVINSTQPLFHDAIRHILKELTEPPKVFTITDFGTADGGTSMPLLYSAVKLIKELCGEEQAVQVIYEDQATNDFKSLFMRLNGFIPGPPSFLKDFSNTFISAIGVSFYTACLPPDTYHLGFSATCMHWLRVKPCNIKAGIHHTLSDDEEEKRMYAKQAAKDWEDVLVERAKEMKKGARFVMAQFCIDENARHLGKTENVKHSMYDVMNGIMKEMVAEKRITQEEFENTTICNYYRTLEEYKAPFQQNESPVVKAGLHLLGISTKVTPCPYHKRWQKEGDNAAHAKSFILTTRVWSNHSFYSGLSDSRPEQERRQIVDEFFTRYENVIAKDPSQHAMDYVHVFMVIEKKIE